MFCQPIPVLKGAECTLKLVTCLYLSCIQRDEIIGMFMFAGAEPTLTPVICSDVAGKDKLAETYGMLNTLCGVGATCGTPLSGKY